LLPGKAPPAGSDLFSSLRHAGRVNDPDFTADGEGLKAAVSLLREQFPRRSIARRSDAAPELPPLIPRELPEAGRPPSEVLSDLAPWVIGKAMPLDSPGSLASMNPPTPWMTWVAALWNAAVNQNLLHPALSPVAGPIERRTIEWLAPYFGMGGGHLVPGSTVANLTGLWAAREVRGIREVVASEAAHVSVRKAANLLGLKFRTVPVDRDQRLLPSRLGDVSRSALVLTAGTSACGAVDPLDLTHSPVAAWTHVDAAWAGPLRFTDRFRSLLDGIQEADSVAFSAHKLLFQPKECAVVLFREAERAHAALSYRADYLSEPNVGLLGSHGAAAVPLLITLLAWGRQGLARRIERCMELGETLAELVRAADDLELWRPPSTGIVVWRSRRSAPEEIARRLDGVHVGTVTLDGSSWLRSAIANPMADPARVVEAVREFSGTPARRPSGR
jgi:L-2,4-diaminobutyrate decarboxylase